MYIQKSFQDVCGEIIEVFEEMAGMFNSFLVGDIEDLRIDYENDPLSRPHKSITMKEFIIIRRPKPIRIRNTC